MRVKQIIENMIRNEVRKQLREAKSLEGAYIVKWVDRDYKEGKKIFYEDPQGPVDNAKIAAEKYKKKLEKADAADQYGKYRSINVVPAEKA